MGVSACVVLVLVAALLFFSSRSSTQNGHDDEFGKMTTEGEFFSPSQSLTHFPHTIYSMALWGGASCYNFGMLENALSLHTYFPHAMLVAYVCPKNADTRIVSALADLPHVRLIMFESGEFPGMVVRMSPAFEWDISALYLIRDADSRPSFREAKAVEDWWRDGKDFHIMRDSRGHYGKILGGMFGSKDAFLSQFREQYTKELTDNRQEYGEDMSFLDRAVYAKLSEDNSTIHSIHCYRYESWSKPFPDGEPRDDEPRENESFVGKDIYTAPLACAHLGLPIDMALSR